MRNIRHILQAHGIEVFDPKNDTQLITAGDVIQTATTFHTSRFCDAPDQYQSAALPNLFMLQHVRGVPLPKKKATFKNKRGFKILQPNNSTADLNKVYYHFTDGPCDLFLCRTQNKVLTIFVFFNGSRILNDFLAQFHLTSTSTSLFLRDIQRISLEQTSLPAGYFLAIRRNTAGIFDVISDCISACCAKYSDHKMSFVLSGWSIGGNAAAYLSPMFTARWGNCVNVVMFGSQRLGKPDLLKSILAPALKPRQILRIFNHPDFVTRLPPKVFGYLHLDEYLANRHLKDKSVVAFAPAASSGILKSVAVLSKLDRIRFWHTTYIFGDRVVVSSD